MSKRGHKQTKEHKEKISKALSGENNPMFGKCGDKNPNIAKKAYKEAIEALRNQYKTEIEPTIKMLVHLRDHAEKDRDKNEAAKLLLKTLGVKMTEERPSANVEREKAKEQEDKFELSPEYGAKLGALLGKK